MPAVQATAELLSNGGPVMMILALLSVLAVTIILVKLWQFFVQRGNPAQDDHALGLWRAGRTGEALSALGEGRGPVNRVLRVAMQGQSKPDAVEATVREETARVAALELERLRGQLRGLEAIGTLSPLLGLLGTVLGMITAFQQLQAAGSQVDPSILSGGIWEALLTTAAGLAVAIPAVAALHWLERRVDGVRHRMEDAVTRVFTQAPSPQPHREPAPLRAAANEH
ncbi:MotA/TolQ/ExbB proton channel family protein [Alkalilimnicola sp. S0819]|uniref:MotA/TolQ/ExbB proton channel family protein n=1 Tax=Alkalilimnicola sp. S0819 TaxID=2613922 RepID=UPI001261A336|nr:MotA/TolQ/ExbB proton channel family protein [Alkalilimnicola sp. S0819]KAB7627653.1 MotA/TolQ/ExbB proton channel family protein [Alkalilimnicola sp. S0819]MPQ15819.1 MotA/TolQ/ExbB proton channel family protein [Alkalilimnicola sp. S0819]